MKECCFCHDLEGHAENIRQLLPELGAKLIVAETPHLLAFGEAYPVVDEPHYLITPREHYQAFSHLPEGFDQEMDGLVRHLADRDFIMFEHGELADKVKVRSVLHAHTHLIPTNRNMLAQVVEKTRQAGVIPQYVHFDGLSTIKQLNRVVDENGYFMFRQGEHGFFVPEAGHELPSQFFRRVIDELTEPEQPFLDWKELDDESKIIFQRRLTNLKEIKR